MTLISTDMSHQPSKREREMPRCNALDDNGRRCKKHSFIEHDYHGDDVYKLRGGSGTEVHWVRINLCIDHAIEVGHDFTKK